MPVYLTNELSTGQSRSQDAKEIKCKVEKFGVRCQVDGEIEGIQTCQV